MIQVQLEELQQTGPSGRVLLHSSGQILYNPADDWDAEAWAILKKYHLPYVIVSEPGEALGLVQFNLNYTVVKVDELSDGMRLPQPLYDKQDRLLLEEGIPISAEFKASLVARDIDELLIRKMIPQHEFDLAITIRNEIQHRHAVPQLSPGMGTANTVALIQKLKVPMAAPEDFSTQRLQVRLNKLTEMEFKAEGQPLAEVIRDTRFKRASVDEKKRVSELSHECLELCGEIYGAFGQSQATQAVDRNVLLTLNTLTSSIMAGVVEVNIMALCTINSERSEYLHVHALAVAVVACQVGARMQLGTGQIKSLVYGALLSDIGLLRVPRIIRMKRGVLDEFERARIKSHPSLGLEMLGMLRELPAEVPVIVFQSHERSNGSGYPCGKSSKVIHLLSKIVAMSDIFVAMCSPRPHRPAHLPYRAVETMLQMAGTKEFDPDLVRTFLEAQSLFPVGSLIQLEDGRIAQVVSSNPNAASRPVIVVVVDEQGRVVRNAGERISLADHPELHVVRPLPNPARTRIQDQLSVF